MSVQSEESEDEAAIDVTPFPKEAIKDLGDGRYKFRSHSVQATSLDAAWESLDAAWQEEQERTLRVQRMAKRDKRRVEKSVASDMQQRPGVLRDLPPPNAKYKEVFHGRIVEDEKTITFTEEDTWATAVVDKASLLDTEHTAARSSEWKEKLYLAVRAEHAKTKQKQRARNKKELYEKQLPKATRDLQVKKRKDTGLLPGMKYAANSRKCHLILRCGLPGNLQVLLCFCVAFTSWAANIFP